MYRLYNNVKHSARRDIKLWVQEYKTDNNIYDDVRVYGTAIVVAVGCDVLFEMFTNIVGARTTLTYCYSFVICVRMMFSTIISQQDR